MIAINPTSKKYYIETFGCQMNVHDSEYISGIVESLGFIQTHSKEFADLIILNTCCIRESAENKIYGKIGELKKLKHNKPSMLIAVLGCMVQQKNAQEKIIKSYPYVDIMLGPSNLDELHNIIQLHQINNYKYSTPQNYVDNSNSNTCSKEHMIINRSSYPNAWVNIMYGCNNFCSYCIVPYVRGRENSRKHEYILNEIDELINKGYKEITLLGQNVNSYGKDKLNEEWTFNQLLEKIANNPRKFRIRFMTSHPKDFNEEIIRTIAQYPNICKNIHLPVQSGSTNILKLMNRKYTREDYLKKIDMIYKYIPNVGITTDIMVGFPGETNDDFQSTLDMVKTVRYSNAYMFVYSRRKGTPAANMIQVPENIKKERIITLVNLQNSISNEISLQYIGKTEEILVEDCMPEGQLCGRTDSGRLVTFAGEKSLIGSFVNVQIESNKLSSLYGRII